MRKLGDSVDSLLSNILESVSNSNPTNLETKEKYVLPVKVGIKNESIEKGDKPWIVGNFAPGKYLNETHPQGHEGVDLKATAGTPIYPVGSGLVLDTMNSPKGGISCKIAHENGAVISYYAHMKEVRVKAQQNVLPTTIIGTVGDTGNAKGRGAHLHYEVKVDGGKVDPLSIVGKDIGSLSKMKKKSDEMFDDLVKMGGLLKYPQELYEDIWEFAEKVFANIVYRFLEKDWEKRPITNYIKKNYEVFNFDVLDTDLDHTIEFETNSGFNTLVASFKYGGKYLSGDYAHSDYKDMDFDESSESIMHEMNFYLGKNEIYKIKSIENFKEDLNDLQVTIKHECRHLQQEIYANDMFVNPNIPEEKIIRPLGGLPPKSTRDKRRGKQEYIPWGSDLSDLTNRKKDLQYELRDIEFYPMLSSSIENFQNDTKKFEENKNDTEEQKKSKNLEKRFAAREYVGDPFDTKQTNVFFSELKKKQPKRWRKAVKEFYKAIFNNELTKTAGLIKVPQELINRIISWVIPQYALFIMNELGKIKISELDNEESIELILFKKEVKKYITTGTRETRKRFIDPTANKSILVELKYITTNPAKYLAGDFEDKLEKIRIFFYPTEELENFKRQIPYIKNTIIHELEHYLQASSSKDYDFFGLPSAKIQSKEFDTQGNPLINKPLSNKQYQEDIEHEDLLDLEFYPRLKDAISEFIFNYGDYSENDKKDMAWSYVDLTNRQYARLHLLESNPFFQNLKKFNIEKWKKAVKEFYKAVFNE